MQVALWSRIPKTASTSLHTRFAGKPTHFTANKQFEVIEMPKAIVLSFAHYTPDRMVSKRGLAESTFREGFVFCVVRNPWARYASLFFSMGPERRPRCSFEEFVLRGYEDRNFAMGRQKTPVGAPQQEWLTLGGEPCCDLTLKLETLDEDWPKLADVLGINHDPLGRVNVTKRRPPYTDVHTQKTIEAISRHEEYVIERFGYQYGEDVTK